MHLHSLYMPRPLKEESGSFTGEFEVTPEYRGQSELVEGRIDYRVSSAGEVEFLAVSSEGKEISLHQVSRASLLIAFAKHRGIDVK